MIHIEKKLVFYYFNQYKSLTKIEKREKSLLKKLK